MSEDLQRQVDFLNAQLRGGRALVKALERQLEEVKTERDKLAGIGIECGCGEASCTADADSLRDALAQIRRLKAELESSETANIHTCSKGCKKQGCNRALRDEIADLKAKIYRLNEALKDEQAVSGHRADEIERLRKVWDWQPIETAPKNGLKVLVYDESFGLPQKAWFGKDHFNEEYEGWLFGDGDDYSCGMYFTPINPTHWMPLPKPPQE